jgi:hypothetical protein
MEHSEPVRVIAGKWSERSEPRSTTTRTPRQTVSVVNAGDTNGALGSRGARIYTVPDHKGHLLFVITITNYGINIT